jgi:hypothetical protein
MWTGSCLNSVQQAVSVLDLGDALSAQQRPHGSGGREGIETRLTAYLGWGLFEQLTLRQCAGLPMLGRC